MARSKAVESEAYTYTVVFEPDEEAGGFTVTCPALRGLVTEGDYAGGSPSHGGGRHQGVTSRASASTASRSPSARSTRRTDLRVGDGQARDRDAPSAGASSAPSDQGAGALGLSIDHVTGSHYILYHPGKTQLRVTVAYRNRDLRPGTLRSIIKQAGLTIDEFIDLL